VQELGLNQVFAEIDNAFKAGNLQRIDNLVWPALNQYPDFAQLWFYAGNLMFQMDRAAAASVCFQRCADLGENPLVLANLGAAYRRLNAHEQGIAVLKAALDRVPDYAPALVNLGSMFVNEGCPNDGIPYLERAVELGRSSGNFEKGSTWNLALLYLEAGRFAEGFDLYRRGLGDERLVRSYGKESKGVTEPAVLLPETTGAEKTLIVWGEQGIGDELMFATCLRDALTEFKQVIFECHPRLEWIYEQTFAKEIEEGKLRLFPTRKDDQIVWPITLGIKADYKCPIGDLAARYRRNLGDFQAAGRDQNHAYVIDGRERDSYRQQLEKISGGRKIVGLATRGGVMQTARTYRTLKIADADLLFQNTNCLFVSLDYDDMSGFATYCMEKYPGRYVWFPSIVQHWDYHHTGALMKACDLVVSVAQSAAHLAAGIGCPTRVLVAKQYAWREAPHGKDNDWYWYPGGHAKLYLQKTSGDWSGPLNRVIEELK
jgi:tetratricopeptide (TPR) repeat protein